MLAGFPRYSLPLVTAIIFSGSASGALLLEDGFAAGGATPGAGQYQSSPASTNGTDNDGLIGQGPGLTGFTSGLNWSPGGGTQGQYANVVYPRVNDSGLDYAAGLDQLITSDGSAEIFRSSTSSNTGDKGASRLTNLAGQALPNEGIYVSALFQFTAGTGGGIALTQGLAETNERDLVLGIDATGNAFVREGANLHTATGVLAAGTNHMLVARFFENNLADLWINPVDLTSEGGNMPALDNVTISYVGNNATYSLDQMKLLAATSQGSSFIFDEVRVGTSWDDVTPTTAIPEPSTFALATLGLLGLIGFTRRKR